MVDDSTTGLYCGPKKRLIWDECNSTMKAQCKPCDPLNLVEKLNVYRTLTDIY